ncbi:MAG: tetratricopeptide repeat protein [Bacteroidales bacterium]|nr:tetratricopeptide repeat protein [Bacteroidales bacterium]
MKKILLKITLVAALFFSSAQFAPEASAQSPAFIAALNLYYQNRTREAFDAFQKVVAEEPDNDAAYFYCALLVRQPSKSQAFFKEALAIDPGNFWYKYYLALSYANSSDMEMASALMEELIVENPNRPSLYMDAINIYMGQNDLEKALATLDKIEEHNGYSEMLCVTRVNLMLRQEKVKEAYAYLEETYKKHPSATIAALLGEYQANLFHNDEAMKYFDEALEMDPSAIDVYMAKAMLYRSMGQYDLFFENTRRMLESPSVESEAKISVLEEMLSNAQFVQAFAPQIDEMVQMLYTSTPEDSKVANFAGIYNYQIGNINKSVEIFKKEIKRNPDNEETYYTYCLMLYYAEDWNALIEATTLAMQKFSKKIDLLQMRGIAFWNIQELESSVEDYKAIVTLNPKDTTAVLTAYSALGDLYHSLNDSKLAYDYYKKALKINPNYAPVLNNYAYYISEDYPSPVTKVPKALKNALTMSRKTIEQEPDNPTYLDTYAWILHLCGQDLEAKAHFKHAMLYGGKESRTIVEHYATVLEALGENDLASIYRKQAKNLPE